MCEEELQGLLMRKTMKTTRRALCIVAVTLSLSACERAATESEVDELRYQISAFESRIDDLESRIDDLESETKRMKLNNR